MKYLGGSVAATESRQIQRLNLILLRQVFGQRNHIETGNNQPVNEHERKASARSRGGTAAMQQKIMEYTEQRDFKWVAATRPRS